MNDEWLTKMIHWCKNFPSIDLIKVDRVELLKRLEQLYWHNLHAARMNEAARKMKESPDDFCRCGGILKTTPDGTCFYCHGKVE